MLTWKDVIHFSVNGNPEPDRRVEKTEQEWMKYVEYKTTEKMIEDWNHEINQSSKLKEYGKIK